MATVEPIEIPAKLVFGVPEVAEVRRLVLRPGDKLVLKVDHLLRQEEADRLIRRLRANLGDVPVLLMEPGYDLEVISPEAGG